jgi:hypothetical protein
MDINLKSELIHKDPKSFVIGGDMGDIVYHLLFIKKLGGTIYHIDPSGGADGGKGYIRNGYIRNGNGNPGKFNLTKALFLLPLIKEQSYLEDVDLYNGDPVESWKQYDVNASEYHKDDLGIPNLTYFHAKKYALELSELNDPWLEVSDGIEAIAGRDTIINRTMRYRGNDNYYFFNRQRLNTNGVFVGLPQEYEDFVRRFGCPNLPHLSVQTGLELAQLIKAYPNFIGNGSLVASIAFGLGQNIEYEYCTPAMGAHYMFQRDNIKVF